jgi:hypothetical protein
MIILIIVILLVLIFTFFYTKYSAYGKMPLVVLYFNQTRTWPETAENHVKLIDHIAQNQIVIVGACTWDEDDNMTEPPEPIKKYKYKMTRIKRGLESDCIAAALQNAEELFKNEFGTYMPDNQPILILRYDGMVLSDPTDLPIPDMNTDDNYVFGTWNTHHRAYNINEPELTYIFLYTTKKSIVLYVSTSVDIPGILVEHDIYNKFKKNKANIIILPGIKTGIQRSSGLEVLSKP